MLERHWSSRGSYLQAFEPARADRQPTELHAGSYFLIGARSTTLGKGDWGMATESKGPEIRASYFSSIESSASFRRLPFCRAMAFCRAMVLKRSLVHAGSKTH